MTLNFWCKRCDHDFTREKSWCRVESSFGVVTGYSTRCPWCNTAWTKTVKEIEKEQKNENNT